MFLIFPSLFLLLSSFVVAVAADCAFLHSYKTSTFPFHCHRNPIEKNFHLLLVKKSNEGDNHNDFFLSASYHQRKKYGVESLRISKHKFQTDRRQWLFPSVVTATIITASGSSMALEKDDAPPPNDDPLTEFGKSLTQKSKGEQRHWPDSPSPLPTSSTSAADLLSPSNNKTLDQVLREAEQSRKRVINPLTHG